MKARIDYAGESYSIDLQQGIDLSIPLRAGTENVNAWYVPPVDISPVKTEQFIGDVNQGGSVNFRNIRFNPHGNGTHTECVGHISRENYSINQLLKQFFFKATLISVEPKTLANGDRLITLGDIQAQLNQYHQAAEALILRTLPNPESKKDFQYSNTNPPYLEEGVMEFLVGKNIAHFLIDLPSVDREMDEGKLQAHHAFWNYPESPATHRTITELIYVPNEVADGYYFLNLQIASFENDASPSKPVIYAIR